MSRLTLVAAFVACALPAVLEADRAGVDARLARRSRALVATMTHATCGAAADVSSGLASLRRLPGGSRLCDRLRAASAPADTREATVAAFTSESDGTLLQRVRLVADASAAIDLVTYASSGLVVGGIVCYPNDGARHSAIIHIHGGTGGIFVNPDGDMVRTCWDWAALHGRTAFAPSLRGQDGGEGRLELCLGEADDVVAGAAMLRSLEVVDPARVGLVGGSVGGCIALRAGPRIPDLAAVVAFVPPTSWKDLVQYHETAWAPVTHPSCSGEPVTWDVGGPAVAEVIDLVICGHRGCSDADYNARSPLPLAASQQAPTLIVSAANDNLVPIDQQVLWSVLRQIAGHPLWVGVTDVCAPPASPPLVLDAHLVVRDAFHPLALGPISSGMLFLLGHLDAAGPAPGNGPASGR